MEKKININKNTQWTAGSMIILYSLIIISLIIYLSFIKSKINERIKQDALNLTSEYVEVLNNELKEQQVLLEYIAGNLSRATELSGREIMDELRKTSEIGIFDRLCYIDSSDPVSTDDSLYIDEIIANEAYDQAMHGNTSISPIAVEIVKDKNSIIICTPVYSADKIRGVLTGIIYPESIGNMLAFDSNTKNVFLLLDDNSKILGINNAAEFKTQWYDFETLLGRFRYKGKAISNIVISSMDIGAFGTLRCEYYGENKHMTYVPIGISEWYLVKLIDYTDVYSPYAPLLNGFYIICVIIIISGAAIGLIIRDLINKMAEINAINRRYSLIDAEQNSLTYTYNRTSRAVELHGAVEQILGKEFVALSSLNLMTLIERMHPEDQDFIKALSKKLSAGDKQFLKEIRVMNPGGGYSWYKLSGIVIDDPTDKNGTIVGNVQSSDEEIDREHTLKRKAETDLLTGLLNKITLEDSVNDLIKEKPHGNFYFYIIDLDNFKEVNDNLGHAMGDNVLIEVSDKLRQIFSEYDRIGRIGGDEFAVLLNVPEGMNLETNNLVEIKAKALNNSLRTTYTSEDKRVTVSASIGIAKYDENSSDYSRLYKHADEVLYYSKRNGKNQYNIYNKETL
ncbi:MAG: diguanylate cyclase [Lachnospiraceae bacterium]|nr:diguanylate cyclase [Lachnospiraceae bacterium]